MNYGTTPNSQPPGLTWNNFSRENLQPKTTKMAKTVASIAVGLCAANAVFALSAHLLNHKVVAQIAASGLFISGLGVLFSAGKLCDLIKTNQRNAELIRALDAGEYIPVPDNDGTGGGS